MRLEDVRVLDLDHGLPGPYGTRLLAEIGAEVVHIQAPPGADEPRSELKFDQLHRCTKRVELNMEQEEGRTPCVDLAETADIVPKEFRPWWSTTWESGPMPSGAAFRRSSTTRCPNKAKPRTVSGARRPRPELSGLRRPFNMTRHSADDPPTIIGYPVADMAGGV
jgi:hypothetical protein